MVIQQQVDITSLKQEINKQIGISTAKTVQAIKTNKGDYSQHPHHRSKKIIVGSRNNGVNEKNSTIGSSRPMTPISGKSQQLNPDLLIFQDRAETKLLAPEVIDKKVKGS